MLLAELDTNVVRIGGIGSIMANSARSDCEFSAIHRNHSTTQSELKYPRAISVVLRLVAASGTLIEKFCPGSMKRLTLGPALGEVPQHPCRCVFVEFADVVKPIVEPRLSRMPRTLRTTPSRLGAGGRDLLVGVDFTAAEAEQLLASI